MQLDEQKKTLVKKNVESLSDGVAYFHFVEYDFTTSIVAPKRKSVCYNILGGKTFSDACGIWLEGLSYLKEYDKCFGTDLYNKNFTEELYLSGDKRISVVITGEINRKQKEPIKIHITPIETISGYKYYKICVIANKGVESNIPTFTGPLSGSHMSFMDNVKTFLFQNGKDIEKKLKVGIADVGGYKKEIDRAFANYPDLIMSGDAITMAILYVWPTTMNPVKSYIALIPPVLEIDNNDFSKQITSCGIALFSNNHITISPHLFDLLQNWVSVHTTKQLLKHSNNEAIKSAKAAIMSRNMSHNLGSHVMAYLKQHLSSVTNMLNDNVLTRLCGEKVDYEKLLDYLEKNVPGFSNINNSSSSVSLSPQDKVGSRLALPFLVGLGHFVSYLQERQDFIATIATDYIPYYATVNFKDSIYDELNPDKRYERHQDRKNQQLDNILLGNIARSEGLGRQTSPTKDSGGKLCDIVLKYKNFDGSICEEGSDAYKSLEELRHLNVSLPGGIVGRQAVFSIVENVIRNAAKHGSWRDVGKLELTFNKYDLLVDDIPDDDNLEGHKSLKEVIDAYYSPAEDINDLYIITLTDNTKCSEEALWKLRLALDDDYIDSAGLMKGANKGLKEMRISAAWLRALKDEMACVNPQIQDHNDVGYIRQKGLKAPILYARIASDENWGEHLQYIFCLPKPKVLAVVSNYLAEVCRNIHIEGCRFYTEDEFAEENNKSYEFILCGDNRYDRIRPYASSRTFTFSESGIAREDLSALKNQNDLSSLLVRLYKEMFDYTEGDKINIDDKKTYGKWKNNIENSKETTLPIEEFSVEETTKESLDEVSTEDNSIQKGLVSGKYLKRGNVLVSDGKICGQYIYRTHHDSIEQFMKFMEAKVDADFVEGITGNNSTDRLVRNEDIDGPWFYRHLHAMKMNVAVCDERLFSKITGLEETDFTRGKIMLATIDNLDDVKEYYSTMSPEEAAIINSFDNPEELNEYVDENFRKDLQVAEKYSKGITAVSYMQKKVYVYTFIQDAEISAKYYLIGAAIQNHKPKYKDANKKNYECQCSRLAELTWSKENGLSVKPFTDGGYIAGYFDYLTVHQGLLDKLYEAFGVKEVPEYKDLLTRQLYEFFCKKSVRKIIPVQVKTPEKVEHRTFLSGMMVHSGRSKPSAQDMPQVLPFIQYAALEHAVMDCKYSLVELLDHARYEQ